MTDFMRDGVHRGRVAIIDARSDYHPVAADQSPAARLPDILHPIRRCYETVDEEDIQGLRVRALAMASRVDQEVHGVEQGVDGRIGAEGGGGALAAGTEDVARPTAELVDRDLVHGRRRCERDARLRK